MTKVHRVLRFHSWSRALGVLSVIGSVVLSATAFSASATATSLMVEDLGAPGAAINGPAYEASRYMGAQYERRIVEVDTWNGSFDWLNKVDPYVNRAIAHGLKPYLDITAKTSLPNSERIPTPSQYRTACTQAATRYNGKVHDYGVWNEPNLTNVGNLDPAGYTLLYKECRSAIKAIDSSANVYFGELSTAASGWGGMNACEYFVSATPYNAGVVTEGISIHPYQFATSPTTKSATHCNGIGRLADWQAELANAKSLGAVKTPSGAQAPLLVSEFGYCGERPSLPPGEEAEKAAKAACPQNEGGLANVKDEATRASWIGQAYDFAESQGVKIFDYHTIIKRPAGDYLGNPGIYLWESGIVNNPSGSFTPSVVSLRGAVLPPRMVVFQANTGALWTYSPQTGTNWSVGLGMATGTSPSLVSSTSGGIEAAFQANTGKLWTYSSTTGNGPTGLGMAAGTSPSIAILDGGTPEVAFHANTGSLWTYLPKSDTNLSLGLGMATETDPGIAPLPGGSYEIAFQANTGTLWTYSPSAGAANTSLGMAAGTSPDVAAIPSVGYRAVFQSSTNKLGFYAPSTGGSVTTYAMAPGTNPSVTLLPGGVTEAAFQGSNGGLWLYSSTTGTATNVGLGMAASTSPSIVAIPNGFEVTFQANSGALWTYSSITGNGPTGLGMAAGTSPSIAPE